MCVWFNINYSSPSINMKFSKPKKQQQQLLLLLLQTQQNKRLKTGILTTLNYRATLSNYLKMSKHNNNRVDSEFLIWKIQI